MDTDSELRSLDTVTAYLPFHLDDSDQVNSTYVSWRSEEQPESKRLVDIWTYCFVRRYFLQKLAREASWQEAELDALVADTYKKVETKAYTISDPSRYAQWVSVICKHTFINHLRARRSFVHIAEDQITVSEPEQDYLAPDLLNVYKAVQAAVQRLPSSLQDVARLRFVERQTYEEIGRATGRPLPIVRAYVSKAVARFRHDPQLLAIRDAVFEA